MIEKLSHIGIAVRDLEAQIAYYRDVLGLELIGREEVAEQQVRTAAFAVGETTIELLEPLSAASPIARFLDRRGEGVHHIAFAVRELTQALDALRAKGVQLVDQQPRAGAYGARIAFAHPRSTGGVLTELCQHGEHRPETGIPAGESKAAK
jgi:methylmalonyl-CoA/ethylmalonyl-CoA epimerase